MTLESILIPQVQEAVKSLYGVEITPAQVQFQKTRAEFEGDITLVVFPFVKAARKAPAQVAQEVGEKLLEQGQGLIEKYNAVQGFLNLSIAQSYWLEQLRGIAEADNYGQLSRGEDEKPLMMVEYSSPNTNKPLHLGHVRNNLLGYSIAKIQEANGWEVVKTNIVNDRGIHICKSDTIFCKGVDVRGLGLCLTIATKIAITGIIHKDEYYIRTLGVCLNALTTCSDKRHSCRSRNSHTKCCF